jgi:hypothetical protein
MKPQGDMTVTVMIDAETGKGLARYPEVRGAVGKYFRGIGQSQAKLSNGCGYVSVHLILRVLPGLSVSIVAQVTQHRSEHSGLAVTG